MPSWFIETSSNIRVVGRLATAGDASGLDQMTVVMKRRNPLGALVGLEVQLDHQMLSIVDGGGQR